MSAATPELSVLIVNFNAGQHLRACLESVVLQNDVDFELKIVDNASSDGSLAIAQPWLDRAQLLKMSQNLGFACAMNRAAAVAQGEWLLLLNPDCVLPSGALRRALDLAAKMPNLGLAGALVRNPDGSIQRGTWRRMPTPWRLLMSQLGLARWQSQIALFTGVDLDADSSGPVEAVNGAFMLLPRAKFEAVSGFDEGYFLHFEDLDLMARIRQSGADVVLLKDIHVAHVKGAAAASKVAVEWAKARSMRRYFARWQSQRRGAWLVPQLATLRVLFLAPLWRLREMARK